jgi:hypothetical protein
VNLTALIPVVQPGDLRQDRVGQLLKRVLDGVASDETRRAYTHSAELVASYRVSLVGEGKLSSTVGVHGAGFRGEDRRHRPAGEPLGAGRHYRKGKIAFVRLPSRPGSKQRSTSGPPRPVSLRSLVEVSRRRC